ncbi:uncharacterized protein LOC103511491 [Diaphorina citri]|uniref:Uncharacterized protein LOC103511491 n=1 Tax=Diaphorina citri TaxID=121845 RepID=A0A1S4EE84_DIACI|nr:uncharacterized protein LOC103511491 [Diaphorina citri]
MSFSLPSKRPPTNPSWLALMSTKYSDLTSNKLSYDESTRIVYDLMKICSGNHGSFYGGIQEVLLRLLHCLKELRLAFPEDLVGTGSSNVRNPGSLGSVTSQPFNCNKCGYYNSSGNRSTCGSCGAKRVTETPPRPPFSCVTSRPRQHEYYRPRADSEYNAPARPEAAPSTNPPLCFINGPEGDQMSSDPLGAYYTNLSWLYYEIHGSPRTAPN